MIGCSSVNNLHYDALNLVEILSETIPAGSFIAMQHRVIVARFSMFQYYKHYKHW